MALAASWAWPRASLFSACALRSAARYTPTSPSTRVNTSSTPGTTSSRGRPKTTFHAACDGVGGHGEAWGGYQVGVRKLPSCWR